MKLTTRKKVNSYSFVRKDFMGAFLINYELLRSSHTSQWFWLLSTCAYLKRKRWWTRRAVKLISKNIFWGQFLLSHESSITALWANVLSHPMSSDRWKFYGNLLCVNVYILCFAWKALSYKKRKELNLAILINNCLIALHIKLKEILFLET